MPSAATSGTRSGTIPAAVPTVRRVNQTCCCPATAWSLPPVRVKKSPASQAATASSAAASLALRRAHLDQDVTRQRALLARHRRRQAIADGPRRQLDVPSPAGARKAVLTIARWRAETQLQPRQLARSQAGRRQTRLKNYRPLRQSRRRRRADDGAQRIRDSAGALSDDIDDRRGRS